MFKVGDVLLCVDAMPKPGYPPTRLRAGGEYRVARVVADEHGVWGVCLEGFDYLPDEYPTAHHDWRFVKRPAPELGLASQWAGEAA